MTSKNNNIEKISIIGAKHHNLKNISLDIPKEKLIVISGVSGSGKSTLAFNTLYAEGQRRYIESLSSYARQFLGKLQKPDVDYINGICPAIAIKQKVKTNNPRSTVGTSTEIYDYLKLLFTRVGRTISPVSKKEVKCNHLDEIVNFIAKQENNKKITIICKYKDENKDILNSLQQKGYSRIFYKNKIYKIYEFINNNIHIKKEDISIVIDRIIKKNDIMKTRISESVETALQEGKGECEILIDDKSYNFSNKYELDGIKFEYPSINLFSFNNPYGACKKCKGFGSILGIDKSKVIPNESLSLHEGAVSCWSGQKLSIWKDRFILSSKSLNFPIHKPYNELTEEHKDLLWNGKDKCKGIKQFFKKLEKDKYKIQNRVLIARYRGNTKCDECNGSRLRKEALYVKINDKNISEICRMSVKEAIFFLKNIQLSKNEKIIAERILNEIKSRLKYLSDVGLNYLSLDRKSNSLSGGESQRINLATSIGSSLVGAMYILDEPSIGLHPKDTSRLIKVLKKLRDIGNTVIVVEHDEEIMQSADQIIDIGPKAGEFGGEIMYQGQLKYIFQQKKSLTTKYLSGELKIPVPNKRRKNSSQISIYGANQNNLQNLNINIPLAGLTLITGMSGSGKSTLVKEILIPALQEHLEITLSSKKNFKKIEIFNSDLKKVEFINQNPIGKSSRSNPATYLKVYEDIRKLFASQPLAKARNFTPGFFSFNVPGGRCEKCQGEGEIIVEMQFMADVHLVCKSCNGTRFKNDLLEVKFQNKNISDILNLSVTEAINFFIDNNQNNIVKKLQPLYNVGLGYIKLGQSSSTLSGGEAQRIKLASFLGKSNTKEKTLFIFDEPTTGLHFHDIYKLLNSFNELINDGNYIICIEHNTDVIKCADWIIDLGPEGGENGGNIIFEGTPEEIISCKKSVTGSFLKKKLDTTI